MIGGLDTESIIDVTKSSIFENLKINGFKGINPKSTMELTSGVMYYCANQIVCSKMISQETKSQFVIQSESIDSFLIECNDEDISVDSNVLLVTGDVEDIVELWDVFKPSLRSQLRFNKMGLWSNKEGLIVVEHERMEFRKDLGEVVIEAVTENNPPFTRLSAANPNNLPAGYRWQEDSKSPQVVLSSSFYGDLWNVLQQTLNFTYTLVG